MDDHYYSEHPHAASLRRTFQTELRGLHLTLTTDRGVFSKSSVDFGSRLLIEHFEEPSITGAILDVGCGYGPIGIAIGKAYPQRQIVMTDINERAVQLARENAAANALRATVFQGDRLSAVQGLFAAVVSNPPIRAGKAVVHGIFADSCAVLLPGGTFWTVVQKKQGAPSALARLRELYEDVRMIARSKGYAVFRAKKA
ncbi:MAG: class I SAM-dependent methyltransferase [Sporolactobacillus sp.]